MRIKLAYGKTGLNINLADDLNVDIVQPMYVESLPDPAGAVRDALRSPIASRSLKELVKPNDKVGIVFNDVTRPTPYRILLPVLLCELDFVQDSDIVLLNATGTHRPNNENELGTMLGDEIKDRFRIVQNDCTDREAYVSVGTSRSGNDIRIHREYLDCDVRILTGFIEPHFFAGFSGGPKACMPGLAQLETILQNHSPENIDSPTANWGVTQGNPIWEDIREATELAGPSFLLNVTLNRNRQITGVFAGDLGKAHALGCHYVRQNAMVPLKTRYDIVIGSNSGYPLDLNLYQSVKGMSAASRVVKEGGSIIIAADCWDGLPEHWEYSTLLMEAVSVESLLETIRNCHSYRQDMWQAQIQASICQKADVYFYSNHLSEEQIRRALLKPCDSIENTVDYLLHRYGRDAAICVLPDGPQTIPYFHTGDG